MKELRENLFDLFNEDLLSLADAGPLKFNPTSATVRRNKRLGVELMLTSDGWHDDHEPDIPPGTLYKAQDRVVFTGVSGTTYTADGVSYRRHESNSSAQGLKTIYHFSLHALEMNKATGEQPAAIVEWIGNLSNDFFGNARVRADRSEIADITIGDGDQSITIKRSGSGGYSATILRAVIGGLTVYLAHFQTRNDDGTRSRDGYIAYKGNPDADTRRKIRDSIGFVLGLPIVLYGHTAYSTAGIPLSMKSESAYGYGGRIFELYGRPPYPINALPSENVIDGPLFSRVVETIYQKYDDLNFLSLSWTYWHGACAAYSIAAVYFGGLIEQLQKTARKLSPPDDGGLLKPEEWDTLKSQLLDVLRPARIDPAMKKIISNKIRGMNQLPNNIALERLFQQFGLRISEAEKTAWKHRNNAAHGNSSTDHESVILNNKLLQLIFHRLLGAITGCSSQYIDYYSLHFPVRAISDPVPSR